MFGSVGFILAVLVGMAAGGAEGAEDVSAWPLPFAIAPLTASPPVIDGKLAEPAWGSSPKLGPLVTLAGGPAKHETYAWVTRSKDTLFVGIRCAFPEGSTLALKQTKRDSEVWSDESIEVFVDAGVSLRKYRHLIVNADNVQCDEAGDKAQSPPFDAAWNGTWQSATSREPTAWQAELAIPFADLGLKPGASGLIGLNVCRNDRAAGEFTCWSPTISGFHQPVRFGVVSLPARAPATPISVSAETPRKPRPGSVDQEVVLRNEGERPTNARGLVIAGNELGRTEGSFALPRLSPGAETAARAHYALTQTGDNAVVIAVADGAGAIVGACKLVLTLPAPRALEPYGYRLAGGEALGLWWAESMYKIHREDPLPGPEERDVRLSAAGNEFEAVQIVLRPPQDMDVSLSVSDLNGPGVIPAANLQLFEVRYVPVWRPTDAFGWVGDWPDPLPPLEGPLHCKRDRNQPVWLLAHVPPDARPGRYRGTVTASSAAGAVSIPLLLTVHGFSLTAETHTKTAYGCGPDYGFQGVSDPAQQEQVFDLYMQSCRDHRISPYSPMARHGIKVQTLAPMRRFTAGRLAVELEKSDRLWKLSWDGKPIASQATSMTHYGGPGVGWQGSGEGWPYLQTITSITDVSRTDDMRVLEVVGAHNDSAAAARSFRLTFRLYIPSGDDWFALRLVKMEGTDPEEIEVRCYFNIPKTVFKAEQVANGPDFAAWSGDDVGFGMLCLGGGFGGLKIAPGADGATVSNPIAPFKIKAGQTHDGWGPLVVYYVTEDTSSAALAARAEDLRKRINLADPASYTVVAKAKIGEERRDDYSFTHDFTEFDKAAARYLDEFHFTAFNEPAMPGSIAGETRFTDGYKRLHKLMYGPIIEHLRQKGWLGKAYAYWYDEPDEQAYPYVRQGMELLKEDCPGLTRLLTEQPEPALFGSVDLWVPVLSMYRPDDCHARQAAGDQVWWYVCCGPGHPYPNNFIDHPGINHRIRFWMAEKYGVEGSLYWATTYRGAKTDKTPKNPYEDAMSYTPDGGYWGNGDGFLLYPACRQPSDTPVVKGPVVSIRWELLRDGLEDREYFWTLKQEMARLEALRSEKPALRGRIDQALRQANAALKLPDALAQSLVVYTKDPQELLRAREEVARAIEVCRAVR